MPACLIKRAKCPKNMSPKRDSKNINLGSFFVSVTSYNPAAIQDLVSADPLSSLKSAALPLSSSIRRDLINAAI